MTKVKNENRTNHSWSYADEYGIETCNICGCLRKRKANASKAVSGHSASNMKWINFYSIKGIKWLDKQIPCK
jgi:hypothetical protein